MRLKERELSHQEARKVSSLHDSFKNYLAPFWLSGPLRQGYV
jgi:hypothetical protein